MYTEKTTAGNNIMSLDDQETRMIHGSLKRVMIMGPDTLIEEEKVRLVRLISAVEQLIKQ